MVFFVAYIVVFAVAALLTFHFFGSGRNSAESSTPDCGPRFFFREKRPKPKPLSGPLLSVDARHAEMLSLLQGTCCAIPVRAESVHVLTRPAQFYEELKRRLMAAQRSIVLSALYIGDGPLSRKFVACLEDKVAEAAKMGQPLDVCLLFDYNRMHDRRNLLTLRHLLVLAHSADAAAAMVRVRLCLFQTPCRWSGLLAPFRRVREALGVQHTKIFCFDGRDTILSGANLSDDYFTTRMDRYVVIENNTHVAAWFSDLVHTFCRISHLVVSPKEIEDGKLSSDEAKNHTKKGDKLTLHKASDLFILPNASGIDPAAESVAFSLNARKLLDEFAARAVAAAGTLSPDEESDTFLFPTLQWARAGVFHDSFVVQRLLHVAPPTTRIYLTSPYLNMDAQFVDEVLASEATFDFITASVNANGWCGAKGFAGYIPYFYLQLERAFFYLMREYGCSDRVRVREFNVDGLTFHAKGFWFLDQEDVFSKKKAHDCGGTLNNSGGREDGCDGGFAGTKKDPLDRVSAPYLVAYGSTNYGYRSVRKDVEAEVFLFTANTSLREALRDELCFLLNQSTLVTEERFVNGAQGRFQPVVSLFAQMGQAYL